jgi:hypothetical protein
MKVTVSEELRRESLPVFIAIAAILALIAVPTSFAADSAPIPAGTQITIRTVDRIESRKAEAGQSYRCTVHVPIVVAEKEISGRGADCVLRVVEITQAGKFTGSSELKLEVAQIRVGSDLVDVTSDPSRMESKGKGKSTGVKTGIGAAAGAGLGGLLGGKKGAVIGTGAGAGAGVATAALTQGPQIKVEPETVLNFVIR